MTLIRRFQREEFLSDLDGATWSLEAVGAHCLHLTRRSGGLCLQRVIDSSSGAVLGESHYVWDIRTFEQWEMISTMNKDLLKKASIAADAVVADSEIDDPKFCERYPTLACFLLLNVTADGEVRERSKICVFAEGGRWKASLQDTASRASLYVTLTAASEAFPALEKALNAERPDWRRWKDQNGVGGKVKPR